jgi:hypothetical protein
MSIDQGQKEEKEKEQKRKQEKRENKVNPNSNNKMNHLRNKSNQILIIINKNLNKHKRLLYIQGKNKITKTKEIKWLDQKIMTHVNRKQVRRIWIKKKNKTKNLKIIKETERIWNLKINLAGQINRQIKKVLITSIKETKIFQTSIKETKIFQTNIQITKLNLIKIILPITKTNPPQIHQQSKPPPHPLFQTLQHPSNPPNKKPQRT